MTNLLYGVDVINDIKNALSGCALTVTDDNVAKLYPELTKDAYVIAAGEKSKSLDVAASLITEMSARRLKRTDTIAALGGGVVGDITGFAASVYMRGIDWINIPTTLLGMVDSSIGGKTAVDFGGVKNLIGTFHEPKSVLISYGFLETLYENDWICGYGELIKTCLLTEASYKLLRDGFEGLCEYDREVVYKLIEKCIEIKRAVVAADPKERGLRRILNVGHTVGHALESLDGYRLSHGDYVMKGMMTECAMCADIVDDDFYAQLISMLKRFTQPPRTSARSLVERAMTDKKNDGGTVAVMLPRAAGDILDVRISRSDFSERYDQALKELKKA